MSNKQATLQGYNRRLFVGSVILVLVLLSVAACLPYRFAGEASATKTDRLLQTWSKHIHAATTDFVQSVSKEDVLEVSRVETQSGSGLEKITINILAVRDSYPIARQWVEKNLTGFDPSDYFIDGNQPDRRIGDLLFINGVPYLLAIEPSAIENEFTLFIGPSLLEDFERLQGEDRTLTVIRKSAVLYSSEDTLSAGDRIRERDLLDALDQMVTSENLQLGRFKTFKDRYCAIAPLKDFDQWDVKGAYVLVRRQPTLSENIWTAALSLLAVALGTAFFVFIGFRQLPAHKSERKSVIWPGILISAGFAIATAIVLILGWLFAENINTEGLEVSRWLLSVDSGQSLAQMSFINSLDMLAIIALAGGALAIALLFISIARRFQHLAAMRQAVAAAGFLAPATIYLAVFTLGPVLFALYISFHSWEVLSPQKYFVGFANFVELFNDPLFWNSLLNTFIYSLHVPVTMAIALGLAMALHQKIRGVTILRTLFFLPYITSFVAISTVWQWLYNTDFGLFNYLLSLIGIEPVAWLSDPVTAMPAVMLMSIWIQLGYQMVIFIAGLQGIPQHLYEAATIDGARPLTQFRRITLPLLRPTIFFILVTSIINSFQVFTYVYVMTQGGPLHSTEVLVYHIYKNAWEYFRMGYASAISWVLFLLILIVTIVQFAYFKKRIEAVTA